MTNAEKFIEVFGATPTMVHCPILYEEDCKKCKGYCKNTDCRNSDWWNSEYIGAEHIVERPQGEWIPNNKSNCFGNPGRSCSLCGKIVEFSENYCPKCGADMRGNK